ncbi:FAD-dependent monooxygenase [Photorhabdus khanii]|uniref:2,4-dichlorophenol 6-monooxygenase n=1 Tax=Photorhabdus khanii subsp. guanajuatensis TaxID=2100166 RepID=A0A4R4JY80_9GAMM|nr:FAD-dependent monooxygenase [Photorhabdus khanii]TDB59768.1 2,4-dichlorophenol 6-monooxygenase [Photorhabdus khanii subsp. guanajuatensis]
MIETDVLIVGSGPSGSAAALFLSTYGINTLVITKHRWLANTPRAHITNQRTIEILSEFSIGDELMASSVLNDVMGNSIFCDTLAGKEIARIKSWGAHPERLSDYTIASPFSICDIPQTYLEPILIGRAVKNGAHVKFSSEYMKAIQDKHGVTVTVFDCLEKREYQIRTKYLIGADGAKSKVCSDAKLPMKGELNLAGCINIFFDADLSALVSHRPGALFLIFNNEAISGGIGVGALRMVRPWKEWLGVWNYDIAQPPPVITENDAVNILKKLIGNYDVDINIKSISTWTVNNMYAEAYSNQRIFCVGDAVHRHPPNNGLGSNTSIQDSYNLCWKLAYVLKQYAGPALLETYSQERVPIGKAVVARAIKSISESQELSLSLGLDKPAISTAEFLSSDDDIGIARRDRFYKALRLKNYELNGHGVELNQFYESAAILRGDIADEGKKSDDLHFMYHSTFIPGARIPHVWLSQKGKIISSINLVGHGQYSLFTGIGGKKWITAVEKYNEEHVCKINAYIIGLGEDVDDIYGDFYGRCHFDETSCILVRPDGHIAWYCQDNKEHEKLLAETMIKILLR